jgi:hypothetical protein
MAKRDGKSKDGGKRIAVEGRELPFGQSIIPPKLHDPANRRSWGLPEDPEEPGEYMVELNLMHVGGMPAAEAAFLKLFNRTVKDPLRPPLRVDKTYYNCFISLKQVRLLAIADERTGKSPKDRAIYRIWPDFLVKGQVDQSVATVKADAAYKAYDASGTGIVWAVIDSGIQDSHPHFGDRKNRAAHLLLSDEVADLHRSFVREIRKQGALEIPSLLPDPDTRPAHVTDDGWEVERKNRVRAHSGAALSDEFGHGTHVAGIITGGLPPRLPGKKNGVPYRVLARKFSADADGTTSKRTLVDRPVEPRERLHGVAPRTKLISLRVLDRNGDGRASDIIRALEYIREKLNDDPKLLRVHGVNLSVGYEFDAEMFACGQSPLCSAVDRLDQSEAPERGRLLRRRQRHEHGGPARLRRHRGVSFHSPGVHRQAHGGQADFSRKRDASGTREVLRGSRPGRSDEGHPIGLIPLWLRGVP